MKSRRQGSGGLPQEEVHLSYVEQERFTFIESRLYWRGRVKREDLRRQYVLSESAANLIFRAYNEKRPGAMTYEPGVKSYVAAEDFTPAFYQPDLADCELERIEAAIPVPTIERATLDGIATAIRQGCALRIEYLSLKGERTVRTVEPLALVRVTPPFPPLLACYCRLRAGGRNFDLSRIRVLGLGPVLKERRRTELELGSLELPVGVTLPEEARGAAQDAFGGKQVVVRAPRGALYSVASSVIGLPELRDKATEAVFQKLLRRLEGSFVAE